MGLLLGALGAGLLLNSFAHAAPPEQNGVSVSYFVFLPLAQDHDTRVTATPTRSPTVTPTRTATPTATPTLNGTPVVLCGDHRGCPDLEPDQNWLYDQQIQITTPIPTSDCAVVEGYAQPGVNRLLRFTLETANVGDGSLVIGDPAQHLDWFTWSDCHKHYHFKDFATYRLWTVDGFNQWQALKAANPGVRSRILLQQNPDVAAQMITARKFGFCAVDYEHASVPNAPPPDAVPQYTTCANQGINRGWADAYTKSVTGQWIEIRDVLGGNYVLEVELNPEHFFTETNYDDNRAWIKVAIPTTTLATRTPSPTPPP
jgi:hypothetical protein